MNRFAYSLRPVRVVFGSGAVRDAGAELSRARLRRALVLSTRGRAADTAALVAELGAAYAGTYDGAELHVPRASVSEARTVAERVAPDSLVSIGGGSAIGLGKALAFEMELPLVAIPTTYSGSEMTDAWGVTDGGRKRTRRDARAAPVVVIYDPDLTLSLPPAVSAASGMNAVAHAVEALYAPDANPVAGTLAREALQLLAGTLQTVVRHPGDRAARTGALRGAHCAGLALGLTTMGLHHKLCHVLGGSFGLPHALTHAVVLPHAVAFNEDAAAAALRPVADALGAPGAASGLFALNRALGLPASLRELGLREGDLTHAAALATEAPYPNPRPVTYDEALRILRAAFEGNPPSTL